MNRTAQANELHVALDVPRHTARQIYQWVRQQEWPEDTQLKQPNDYHVTLLYADSDNDIDPKWIHHLEQATARINGVSAFPAQQQGGYAYVLTLDAPDIEDKANQLNSVGQWMGLPVATYPDGFRPHVTVAYGSSPRLPGIKAPNFEFDLGPSSVSPPKRHASAPIDPPNYRKGTAAHHCGNCKMFFEGHCWGYGNHEVEASGVCDSWSADRKSSVQDNVDGPDSERDNTPDSQTSTYHYYRRWIDNADGHKAAKEQYPQEAQPQPSNIFGHEARVAYDPESVKVLDQLSLNNVAHNLHYRFQQGGMDAQAATDYAKRLLQLIGYPLEDLNVQAALQAWQQMYPQDKVLPAVEQSQALQAPATTPTESWGYGTTSKVAEQRGWTDFYHVSPRSNRESIQNLGLMGENGTSPWSDPWKRNQPHGNYMFDNPHDAQAYAWNLHMMKHPGGADNPEWDPNFDYEQDDPNGYDIWRVNTRGLPIHRDPEVANSSDGSMTPDRLRNEFKENDYPSAHNDFGGAWQQQLMDQAANYGDTPRRFYIEDNIEPERLQLHQHQPTWDMSEEDYYDHLDDSTWRDQASPLAWDEMQLRRPQFPAHSKQVSEKFAPNTGALSQTLRHSSPRHHLYHWLDASDIHDWMDPSHTGPGHTYLTESGSDPTHEWNDDVPRFDNPVRLTIDANHLQPHLFDQTYNDWLGNYLYHGPIAPEAVSDIKAFKRPDEWDEDFSTIPTPVNSPGDHWPEWGDTEPDKHRDIQFSNDSAWSW